MEVLLEIALSIGESLELDAMLDSFLGRTTRLTNRSVTLLVEVMPTKSPSVVHSVPRNFQQSERAVQLLQQIDWQARRQQRNLLESWVKIGGTAMSCLSFEVPEHGYLLLVGDKADWSPGLLDGLQLISNKLAVALSACYLNSQLKERSRQLELATRAGSIGVWDWNLDHGQLTWNEQMCRLYGIAPSQFSRAPEAWFSRIHPEDRDEVQARVQTFVDYGGDDTAELHFRIRTDDGTIRKLIGFGMHHVNADGSRSMVGVNYDASRMELSVTQTLYRSELEKLLLDLSMKVILAPAGRLDEITNSALQDVGRFVGADRAYRIDYDFATGLSYNTHEWCAEGVPPEIENLQAVPVDAIPMWVNSHKKGLPYYISRVQDLDPNHGAREILEPQGVLSIVTIPLMYEGSCLGFIGFDAVSAERHWSDVDIAVLRVLAQLIVNAQTKSQNELRLESSTLALRRSRNAARRLALAAEQANQTKSRFVATVSHEIRTPLHAILGLTEVLAEKSLPESAQELVASIQESGELLLELINDVLDFSRIESGGLEIQSVEFSLLDLFEVLRKLFESSAQKRGLKLEFEVSPLLSGLRVGDPLRLRQILNNLLSNALKFTDHGMVKLTAAPDSQRPTHAAATQWVEIRVSDTGIGISPSDQQRLFEAFFQADTSDTRSYAGTGLGLTIVDMLVKRMGGELSVSSAPGEGAEFAVSLPLLQAESASVQITQAVCETVTSRAELTAEGVRILLAEDNPVNRQLVVLHLQGTGCELVLAENGEEAVTRFREQPFDLVLMDCQMPVMDGFAATAAIRRTGPEGAQVPILAVTASGTGEDVSRCLQLGMNDVLIKPFSRAQLMAMIVRWHPAAVSSKPEEKAH